ncbi:MAG: hypothetical protein V2I66_12550 [Halieaceae bacterium]|jgi:hypothetical protein|nr:hypothetical protein [Halieaceae bacterium]
MNMHPDDKFHTPVSDDPFWTETCWFTFAVPEHKLSGQLYPFFRPNQGVYAAGAYFWDHSGHEPHTIRYGKNFWHLPMPDQDLTDIQLLNGISIRCLEPQARYAIRYVDPDAEDVEVDLTFTAIAPPNHLGESHYEQPGHYQGTLRLEDETFTVDSYGMRDRSWSLRPQFGPDIHGSGAVAGGYSYATADPQNSFHIISMEFAPGECIGIHGYFLRNGEYARLVSGKRVVETRDTATGAPTRVLIEAEDELGRSFRAEGKCLNKIGLHLNPNLFTWNCLTRWTFDGATGFGEDHDNWSSAGARHFFRSYLSKR